MFCKRCGALIKDEALFCNNCGAAINSNNLQQRAENAAFVPPQQTVPNRPNVQNAPIVPNQPINQSKVKAPKNKPTKQKNKPKSNKKSTGKKGGIFKTIIIPVSLVLVFVLAVVLAIRLTHSARNSVNTFNSQNNYSADIKEYIEQPIDAEALLKEKGEIISKTEASKSNTVLESSDAINDFNNRGFHTDSILSTYNINGELDEKVVTKDDGNTHPVYLYNYTSPDGNAWQLLSVNGKLMAYPLTYNLQENKTETAVIVSESNSVFTYDCATNTFFEIIPNGTAIRVIQAEQINKSTLDNLSIGD